MKKFNTLIALLLGICTFAAAELNEVVFDTNEKYDFAVGGFFVNVSNNGKYAVGSSDMTYTAFYYDVELDTLILLNPDVNLEPADGFRYWATANDVSDNGTIVGRFTFERLYSVPAYYNISTGKWTELPLSPDVLDLFELRGNGEATSISVDGKYIAGYISTNIYSYDFLHKIAFKAPCLWVNKGSDEAPDYQLQMPIENDPKQIQWNGDYAMHMSDDGQYLGGYHVNFSGCENPAIWINRGEGKVLERHVLLGRESLDYENPDGTTDEEMGGALAGQYFWETTVTDISPNGEWMVGYHNYNGTGYCGEAPIPTSVGFKYNIKTQEFTDSLFVLPNVVFDDGEMISQKSEMDMKAVLCSSTDKTVQGGVRLEAVEGLGIINMPYMLVEGYNVKNDMVNADLEAEAFTYDGILYVEGEFTSIDIFSVLGAHMASFGNDNNEIDLSNIPNGVYVVRIVDGNKFKTQKIRL